MQANKFNGALVVGWLAVVINAPSWVRAQAPPSADGDAPVNALATKQQMIEERIARLEDRMFRLREKLAETEPQNAEKLAMALEQAGRLNIKGRTGDIIELLESSGKSAGGAAG